MGCILLLLVMTGAKAQRSDAVILYINTYKELAMQEMQRTGVHVPVAIITGHDKPEYRARAVAAGVAAYLPKPIDDKELIGVIAAAARPADGIKAMK